LSSTVVVVGRTAFSASWSNQMPSSSVKVHAAAGGLGQILTRWGNSFGATVIGIAGSDAKRALACDVNAAWTIALADLAHGGSGWRFYRNRVRRYVGSIWVSQQLPRSLHAQFPGLCR